MRAKTKARAFQCRLILTVWYIFAAGGQRVYAPQPQGLLTAAQNQEFNASEITGREIDLAVRNLLEADDVTARATLEKRGSELDAGAKLPLSKEL